MNRVRKRRMLFVAMLGLGVSGAAALVFAALSENLNHFYSPTEFADGVVPSERNIRVGGLVKAGSLERTPGALDVSFKVTDTAHEVRVFYAGILPDLFREGQGIIAKGQLDGSGVFRASEVLAKHDENYMPPEVAAAIDDAHKRFTVPQEAPR